MTRWGSPLCMAFAGLLGACDGDVPPAPTPEPDPAPPEKPLTRPVLFDAGGATRGSALHVAGGALWFNQRSDFSAFAFRVPLDDLTERQKIGEWTGDSLANKFVSDDQFVYRLHRDKLYRHNFDGSTVDTTVLPAEVFRMYGDDDQLFAVGPGCRPLIVIDKDTMNVESIDTSHLGYSQGGLGMAIHEELLLCVDNDVIVSVDLTTLDIINSYEGPDIEENSGRTKLLAPFFANEQAYVFLADENGIEPTMQLLSLDMTSLDWTEHMSLESLRPSHPQYDAATQTVYFMTHTGVRSLDLENNTSKQLTRDQDATEEGWQSVGDLVMTEDTFYWWDHNQVIALPRDVVE